VSKFRQTYRQLDEHEKALVESIKDKAEELLELYQKPTRTGQREMALAITKLEESIMWATKGITG
jgi:hypothetical protein